MDKINLSTKLKEHGCECDVCFVKENSSHTGMDEGDNENRNQHTVTELYFHPKSIYPQL